MATVSILVPNYNHASYLQRRIDSILSQTYRDFELIILDDGSSDNSREVIEQYRSEPCVSHIIYNDVNSGSTFSQWSKGISVARGEYIWIAESDDYCEPGFLQELVPPLQKDPAIVMSFCQCLFVSPKGKIIAHTSAPYLSEYLDGTEFLGREMLGTNAIPNVSMLVFRKSAVEAISREYLKMKYCGDWLFYSSLALQGNVYISGKYLNYYLRHEATVTSGAVKQGYDFLEGNEVFGFIKNNVNLEEADLVIGLNKTLDRYFRVRKEFSDEAVDSRVLESLWALDGRMKGLFRKREKRMRLRDNLQRLRHLFLRQ